MGKNPNAKKLKEKKHKEREFGQDIGDLEEEAAIHGVSIYDLDKVKKDLHHSDDSEEESEESDDDRKKPAKKQQKPAKKLLADKEEEKEEPKAKVVEEVDSADEELERLYGRNNNRKN
jgi:hypothetical protein